MCDWDRFNTDIEVKGAALRQCREIGWKIL